VHLGHVLRATSKNNVALLQDDVLSALNGRLETRSTKTVDCEARRLCAAPGLESNVTSHVGGILGGLLHLKESNGVLKYRNDDFLLTFPKTTWATSLGSMPAALMVAEPAITPRSVAVWPLSFPPNVSMGVLFAATMKTPAEALDASADVW